MVNDRARNNPGNFPSKKSAVSIHFCCQPPDDLIIFIEGNSSLQGCPGNNEPEPGKQEYYIDSYHFADAPLVTPQFRAEATDRGGSGIVTVLREGDLLVIKRDIILGKNIPGYP